MSTDPRREKSAEDFESQCFPDQSGQNKKEVKRSESLPLKTSDRTDPEPENPQVRAESEKYDAVALWLLRDCGWKMLKFGDVGDLARQYPLMIWSEVRRRMEMLLAHGHKIDRKAGWARTTAANIFAEWDRATGGSGQGFGGTRQVSPRGGPQGQPSTSERRQVCGERYGSPREGRGTAADRSGPCTVGGKPGGSQLQHHRSNVGRESAGAGTESAGAGEHVGPVGGGRQADGPRSVDGAFTAWRERIEWERPELIAEAESIAARHLNCRTAVQAIELNAELFMHKRTEVLRGAFARLTRQADEQAFRDSLSPFPYSGGGGA